MPEAASETDLILPETEKKTVIIIIFKDILKDLFPSPSLHQL